MEIPLKSLIGALKSIKAVLGVAVGLLIGLLIAIWLSPATSEGYMYTLMVFGLVGLIVGAIWEIMSPSVKADPPTKS